MQAPASGSKPGMHAPGSQGLVNLKKNSLERSALGTMELILNISSEILKKVKLSRTFSRGIRLRNLPKNEIENIVTVSFLNQKFRGTCKFSND